RVRYTENLESLGILIGFEIIEPAETAIGLPLHSAMGVRAPDGAVTLYYGDDRDEFLVLQAVHPVMSPSDPVEIEIDGQQLFTWRSYDEFVNYSWHGCERNFHVTALAEQHGDRARAVTESLLER